MLVIGSILMAGYMQKCIDRIENEIFFNTG